MENRVYCHTTYNEYSGNIENNWYLIYHETDDSYVIQHSKFGNLSRFYKNNNYFETYSKLFSDYFYTEQEYNRVKNLNDLLNE